MEFERGEMWWWTLGDFEVIVNVVVVVVVTITVVVIVVVVKVASKSQYCGDFLSW